MRIMKLFLVAVAGFVGLMLLTLAASLVFTDSTEVSTAAPVPLFDKSDIAQAARLEYIKGLGSAGLITEIKVSGGMPYVIVRQPFIDGDFADKQNIIAAIYAYYFDGSKIVDSVRILDAKTNKELGHYRIPGGLTWK